MKKLKITKRLIGGYTWFCPVCEFYIEATTKARVVALANQHMTVHAKGAKKKNKR